MNTSFCVCILVITRSALTHRRSGIQDAIIGWITREAGVSGGANETGVIARLTCLVLTVVVEATGTETESAGEVTVKSEIAGGALGSGQTTGTAIIARRTSGVPSNAVQSDWTYTGIVLKDSVACACQAVRSVLAGETLKWARFAASSIGIGGIDAVASVVCADVANGGAGKTCGIT